MLDTIQSTAYAFARMRNEPWQNLGDALLVGEGNMSFAKSLINKSAQITHMTATTLEKENSLTDEAHQNASALQRQGAIVLHGVDATKLEESLQPQKFDTIIFQFPNAGSRDGKYGHTSNHVLIRKFLRSAAQFLNDNGSVLITAVDSPHYDGVFKFDEAAEFADYLAPRSLSFDPAHFTGYSHTNTNDANSAIDDHTQFATWIFKRKK